MRAWTRALANLVIHARALNVSDRDETVHTATCQQVVGRVRRLKTYRQRICVLDRPQTLLLLSPDRSCEPGHAFLPTWSSTLRHVLVPGSHGPRLKPPAVRVIIGVEKRSKGLSLASKAELCNAQGLNTRWGEYTALSVGWVVIWGFGLWSWNAKFGFKVRALLDYYSMFNESRLIRSGRLSPI